MTPRQLSLCVDVYLQTQKRQQDNDIIHAWFTAYCHRVNKFPKLNSLINIENSNKATKPEDMLAKLKAANEALGGTTY